MGQEMNTTIFRLMCPPVQNDGFQCLLELFESAMVFFGFNRFLHQLGQGVHALDQRSRGEQVRGPSHDILRR
jgi:hypothetical protein